MTFEAIYNVALDVLNKLTQERGFLNPGDTVCVISSRSGRVYNGVSHVEMINGVPTSIHAEVDAIRNMQNLGEFAVDTLVLIDAATRSPMLPCNNCISYILSINAENQMGNVAMPDRLIPLPQVGMFAAGGAPMGANPMGGAPMGGAPAGGMPMGAAPMGGMPMGAAPMGGMPMNANPAAVNPAAMNMNPMDANPIAANPVPQSMVTSVPVSQPLAGGAKGDLLKNRVSSIMSIAEEEDDDDDILAELGISADDGKKDKKKKRFGLFG